MRLGAVLFQLGGPDSPESIEPFLYNLFCDPDIIYFPLARVARNPLARLISMRRAKYVAQHYAGLAGRVRFIQPPLQQNSVGRVEKPPNRSGLFSVLFPSQFLTRVLDLSRCSPRSRVPTQVRICPTALFARASVITMDGNTGNRLS